MATKKYLSYDGLIEYDGLIKGVIDAGDAAAKKHATDLAAGKSDIGHTHDDLYYTELEINSKLSEVNTSITNITSGTTVVKKAEYATSAGTATTADSATNASHATNADKATTADSATNATHATNADKATTADSATNATKATQDGSGNVITSTYETKSDASAKLTEAKTYTDTVAAGKSDTGHNHDDKYDAKNSASTALESAKAYSNTNLETAKDYTDSKISELLDGADDKTLDSIKELADAIKENDSAIDTLNRVASGKADAEHDHGIADVTGLQDALDKKANSSHGTHVTYSTTAPVMDGTASVGTASTVARSDHKHPTDTSRASQEALDELAGTVAGKSDNGHKHAISDVTNLQSTLNAKATQVDFEAHTGNTTVHITGDERTKWNNHVNSSHAPSNAQENVIESIKVNGTAQTITNKAVNITVPTKASDINAAEATHGHAISEITNLQTTLNNAASAIGANTKSIEDHNVVFDEHASRIESLETKVGDGFEEISSEVIRNLFNA